MLEGGALAMDEALGILGEVKSSLGLPLVTDIHLPEQAAPAAEAAPARPVPAAAQFPRVRAARRLRLRAAVRTAAARAARTPLRPGLGRGAVLASAAAARTRSGTDS